MNIIFIIDKLRNENQMSVSTLCDGICSRRTYYRYRDESHEIPLEVLEMFCSRLNVTVKEIYSLSQEKTNPIYIKINQLGLAIQKEDLDKSKALLESIDTLLIDNPAYTNMYEYLSLKYKYLINEISVIDYYSLLTKMISTFHITFDSFSTLDLMVLFELAKIEIKDPSKGYFATNQLSEALVNIKTSTITNDTIHMILPVYELIISHENKKKNYDYALKLSYKGIELSNVYYSMQSLRSFYYIIGKISLEHDDYVTADEYFHKCLYVTSIKDNQEMFDLFKGFITTMLEEKEQKDIIEKINKVLKF